VRSTRRKAARLNILLGILMLGFGVLLARLAWVCLVNGHSLALRAVEQRSVDATVSLSRGLIFDRNMEPLAGGASTSLGAALSGEDLAHAVAIFPQSISGSSESLERLEAIVPGAQAGPPRIVRLPARHSDAIAQIAEGLRGVVPIAIPRRWPGLAAHVIGYLTGSQVGADGIEATFERILGGSQRGREVVRIMCDPNGRDIPGLGARLAMSGQSRGWVRLSIDSRVQAAAEHAFDRRAPGLAGAVVVMDPWTGQVIAMASRPSYDQNDVSKALSRSDAPLLNRALHPYYPGSVFKVVVAAAALAEGAMTPESVYHDSGTIQAGGHLFKCHAQERGGHGDITFADAVAHSCNTAFVYTALSIGPTPILNTARALGIGSYDLTASLRLPNASTGQTPPRQQGMAPAELANFALGQSVVEMTALEASVMMCTVANGGILRQPTLVMETFDLASGVTVEMRGDSVGTRVLDSDVALQLRSMLWGVVSYGTAEAALGGRNAAGKTGTAQTGRIDGAGQPIYNAWFVGFAPADRPRIVITVLVEGAESGADLAAPIFGDICDEALGLIH
jgi:penicillin-binding protein 2